MVLGTRLTAEFPTSIILPEIIEPELLFDYSTHVQQREELEIYSQEESLGTSLTVTLYLLSTSYSTSRNTLICADLCIVTVTGKVSWIAVSNS